MHGFGHRGAFAACLALACLAPGRAVEAGYIAGDLGTGGTFGQGSYNLTGPRASTGPGYGLAVEFSVSGAAPIAFGSAQLALSYQNGANLLDVLLATDGGGTPGATLETIHLAGISSTAGLVTANSALHPLLTPGTHYWLVAVASSDAYLYWYMNPAGQAGHLAFRTDTGSGPGAWGASPNNVDPAFAITAVPGPPGAVLLGIGLIGLAGCKARTWSRARNGG